MSAEKQHEVQLSMNLAWVISSFSLVIYIHSWYITRGAAVFKNVWLQIYWFSYRITFRSPMMSSVLNCRHCPLLCFSAGAKGKKGNTIVPAMDVQYVIRQRLWQRWKPVKRTLCFLHSWFENGLQLCEIFIFLVRSQVTSHPFFDFSPFCVTSKRSMDGERGKMSAQLSWVKFISWTLNRLSRVIDIDATITLAGMQKISINCTISISKVK